MSVCRVQWALAVKNAPKIHGKSINYTYFTHFVFELAADWFFMFILNIPIDFMLKINIFYILKIFKIFAWKKLKKIEVYESLKFKCRIILGTIT